MSHTPTAAFVDALDREGPLDPQALRDAMQAFCEQAADIPVMNQPIIRHEVGRVFGAFKRHRPTLLTAPITDEQRHSILHYLFGVKSTNDLTHAQGEALLLWMDIARSDRVGLEMTAILDAERAEEVAKQKAAGQTEMWEQDG